MIDDGQLLHTYVETGDEAAFATLVERLAIEPLPDGDKIDAARAAVEAGEWCDFAVIAQGPRIAIQVNGATVVDTRDEHPVKFVPVGMLGLEYSHRRDANDAVEFKDIRFKRLTPANP
jgi:hypothetical protein